MRVDPRSDGVEIGPRNPGPAPAVPPSPLPGPPPRDAVDLAVGSGGVTSPPADGRPPAHPPVEARRDPPRKPPGEPQPAADPYQERLKARKAEADRCTVAHGDVPPGTTMTIVIGPDGHPKRVALDPAEVDATPLGACIRRVFRGATFPRADRDHEINVRIHPS
jgi:hypothetical protein